MICSRRQNVFRWPQFWRNISSGSIRQCRGGCKVRILLVATLFVVQLTSSSAQEPSAYLAPQASQSSPIAGSQLRAWWGKRGDVEHAVAQLGGVQWCSEGVNARVDSEFLENEMLRACRQETGGCDVMDLLHAPEELKVPSEEQTTRLCRSEACAAWLSLAVEAPWLPECKYRNSQTSLRSLAETLLHIREDLVGTFEGGVVVAPNATLFREFYELNQLANLLGANKEGVLNEMGSPVPQVARQMTVQEAFSLMESGGDLPTSAVVELPGSNSGTSAFNKSSSLSASDSSTPSTSSSSGSTSNSSSVGDILSGSGFDSNDTAGFTNSGSGPHASSTTTTTDLTPSYAYVVGAWVLFNGSYFFLMRRK